jgi:hypothetical protein
MEECLLYGHIDLYKQKQNLSRIEAEVLWATLSTGAYRTSRTDLQVVSCGRLYSMCKWNEAVSNRKCKNL